jgi:hypothetical protein
MTTAVSDLAPAVPRDTPASSVLAVDAIYDALSMLPTGEWRRSARMRVCAIEGAIEGWASDPPTPEERTSVIAASLDLFSEVMSRG